MIKNEKMRFYGDMEELVDHLESFEYYNEITRFEIVEKFGDKQEKRYEFINLKAETFDIEGEKGMIFIDEEEKIYNTYSVLLGFLEHSIQSAYYSTHRNGLCEIRLIFPDGYADIKTYVDYQISDYEEESACCLDMDSPEMKKVYKDYYLNKHDYSYQVQDNTLTV